MNQRVFKRIGLIVTGMSLMVFLACERQDYDIGGRAAMKTTTAKSDVEPSVYALAAASHVSDVAPKIGGEIDAQALYTANCSACHQSNGLGVPGAFPPLDKSPYVTGNNVERLAAIMIYGLSGPIKVLGQDYNSVMLPLGATMNDDQLAAVASYIRSSWSNSASAVEPAVFAKVRQQYGERGMFTIQELGEEP